MEHEKLLYGICRRNINPRVPISLAGYFNKRMWEKVLDDLEVRVLTLRQDEQYFALIQFDLVTVSQELVEELYQAIADIKELSPQNMIVTATHTHTAPEVRSTRPGGHPDYIPFVARQTAEALREALANMLPGDLYSGATSDSRFCFNRRYWMKDGTVVTNPGKLNPDIDRPEGQADYEIPIIAIKRDGNWQVIIANIVNHTDTVGGNNVSGDWAGFFVRQMQGIGNGDLLAMPLIGCAGNINHFDVASAMNQTSYEEAGRIGSGYAETVAKALDRLSPVQDFKLTVCQSYVESGPREISEAEMSEAKQIMERYKDVPDVGDGVDLTSEDLAQKKPIVLKHFARNLLDMANNSVPARFNLVGVFMGKCCIVSLPSEPFVEIGLKIKKDIFHEYNAMVVSHANGTGHMKNFGGYIPMPDNYGRGGYETTPRSNRVSIETADRLVKAWSRLKRELCNAT